MKLPRPILFALLLLLGFALGSGLSASSQNRASTDSVRYVDVQRCLDGWSLIQTEMKTLSEEFTVKWNDFRVRETSLKDRENEIAILDPASEEYSSAVFQIEGQRAEMDRERRFVADRLQERKVRLLLQGWQSVQDAAAELAIREGWSAVVTIPQALSLAPENLVAQAETLSFRSVLWTHPDHDVTDAVLSHLNARN